MRRKDRFQFSQSELSAIARAKTEYESAAKHERRKRELLGAKKNTERKTK
jgi:hypothetical protein